MVRERTDATGSPATVELDEHGKTHSYVVRPAGEAQSAGHADFVRADGARIFFHTEVAPQFGGRGLAGLLVRTALAESIDDGVEVVPVCPLFAAHLRTHGEAFRADGGRFRPPRPADLALVRAAVRGE